MSEHVLFDWIIPRSILENTPSMQDGYSKESERQYRNKSAWFIETLGLELRCERLVVSTACVLFHRFFVFQSLAKHNRFIISAACLFLASKVEESYRPAKDVAVAYKVVRSKAVNFDAETECNGLLEKLLLAERIVLQTLCFDLQIVHPYTSCLLKTKALKSYVPTESRREFHQTAVNFVNDSYRTSLCTQYPPHQITTAALYLATLHLSIKPVVHSNTNQNITSNTSQNQNTKPSSTNNAEVSWFELLESDIDEDSLKDICYQILNVYSDQLTAKAPGLSELRSKLDGLDPSSLLLLSRNRNESTPEQKDHFSFDRSDFNDPESLSSSENKSEDHHSDHHRHHPHDSYKADFIMPTKILSYGKSSTIATAAAAMVHNHSQQHQSQQSPSLHEPIPPPTPPIASPPMSATSSHMSASPPPPPTDYPITPGYYIQLSPTRDTPDYIPPPPSDTPSSSQNYESWPSSQYVPPPPPPMSSADTPNHSSPGRSRSGSEDEPWVGPTSKRPRVESM